MKYYPSTLDYVVLNPGGQSLFSRAEKTYMESHETFTTNDEARIKAFALALKLGFYKGLTRRRPTYMPSVYVTCYHNEKRLVSFYLIDRTVITEHKRKFEYLTDLPNLEIIEPLKMQQFRLRRYCARNMERLRLAGPLRDEKVSVYPDGNQWCDAIVQFCRNQYSIRDGVKVRRITEEWISETIVCPSVRKRGYADNSRVPNKSNSKEQPVPLLECHYAMNTNCEPNSPPDTVLLFETKAGWNQHGGPELFTFYNHDPKGGCVVLNDGTVKFIRTREELQQLRWK